MQVYKALGETLTDPKPYHLFPSSQWMVEVQGEEHEFFTSPLLALPEPVNGHLQVARAESNLDFNLRNWVYSDDDNPVIYVAFGTIVQGVKSVVTKIVEALREDVEGGKWRVLWSFPSAMHKWLPKGLSKDRWRFENFVNQREVLRCDRVKLFISHNGANSTMEALSYGVPMVCHPFYMDQYEWASTVVLYMRAGIFVDKVQAGVSQIRGAVTEVLEDPRYAENALAVGQRLQDQAAALTTMLGPSMAPTANMGIGVSVVAAVILCLIKGEDPKTIIKMVQRTV